MRIDKFVSVLIQLALCIMLAFLAMVNNTNYTDYQSYYSILQYLSMASVIVFLLTNQCRFISPYTFIILFAYLFNCGQVWLSLFGIDFTESSYTIDRYTYQYLAYSLSYFLLAINIIHLFGLAAIKRNKGNNTADEINILTIKKDDYKKNLALTYTGILILILCIIFLTYNDIQQIIAASRYGSDLAYVIGRNDRFLYALINLFPLAIIILMVTVKTKKVRRLVVWYAIIRSVLLMILVGNRGQYIVLLCTIMLVNYSLYNQEGKRSFIKYAVIGFFLVFLVSFVAALRNAPTISLSSTFIINYMINHNAVVELLQEMGGTLVNTILVFMYSPSQLPYGMGISFLGSFISFFPLASRLFPELVQYIDLGLILNGFFFKGSGLGGSFTAELLFNFSWYSLFFMPFIGILFIKFSRIFNDKKILINQSSLKISIYSYMAYALMMYVRGNFYTIILYMRFLVYVLILYFLILAIVNKYTKEISNEEKNKV